MPSSFNISRVYLKNDSATLVSAEFSFIFNECVAIQNATLIQVTLPTPDSDETYKIDNHILDLNNDFLTLDLTTNKRYTFTLEIKTNSGVHTRTSKPLYLTWPVSDRPDLIPEAIIYNNTAAINISGNIRSKLSDVWANSSFNSVFNAVYQNIDRSAVLETIKVNVSLFNIDTCTTSKQIKSLSDLGLGDTEEAVANLISESTTPISIDLGNLEPCTNYVATLQLEFIFNTTRYFTKESEEIFFMTKDKPDIVENVTVAYSPTLSFPYSVSASSPDGFDLTWSRPNNIADDCFTGQTAYYEVKRAFSSSSDRTGLSFEFLYNVPDEEGTIQFTDQDFDSTQTGQYVHYQITTKINPSQSDPVYVYAPYLIKPNLISLDLIHIEGDSAGDSENDCNYVKRDSNGDVSIHWSTPNLNGYSLDNVVVNDVNQGGATSGNYSYQANNLGQGVTLTAYYNVTYEGDTGDLSAMDGDYNVGSTSITFIPYLPPSGQHISDVSMNPVQYDSEQTSTATVQWTTAVKRGLTGSIVYIPYATRQDGMIFNGPDDDGESTTSLFYTFDNLPNGDTYTFNVRAIQTHSDEDCTFSTYSDGTETLPYNAERLSTNVQNLEVVHSGVEYVPGNNDGYHETGATFRQDILITGDIPQHISKPSLSNYELYKNGTVSVSGIEGNVNTTPYISYGATLLSSDFQATFTIKPYITVEGTQWFGIESDATVHISYVKIPVISNVRADVDFSHSKDLLIEWDSTMVVSQYILYDIFIQEVNSNSIIYKGATPLKYFYITGTDLVLSNKYKVYVTPYAQVQRPGYETKYFSGTSEFLDNITYWDRPSITMTLKNIVGNSITTSSGTIPLNTNITMKGAVLTRLHSVVSNALSYINSSQNYFSGNNDITTNLRALLTDRSSDLSPSDFSPSDESNLITYFNNNNIDFTFGQDDYDTLGVHLRYTYASPNNLTLKYHVNTSPTLIIVRQDRPIITSVIYNSNSSQLEVSVNQRNNRVGDYLCLITPVDTTPIDEINESNLLYKFTENISNPNIFVVINTTSETFNIPINVEPKNYLLIVSNGVGLNYSSGTFTTP